MVDDFIFSLEVLGDGTQFNNTLIYWNRWNIITNKFNEASNNHFGSGSFGGRADNGYYLNEIYQKVHLLY